jgi:hypothetical protein
VASSLNGSSIHGLYPSACSMDSSNGH